MNSHLGELPRDVPQCVTLLVDLIYQECSEGPAYDEASAVLLIKFLKGGQNGFADFWERRSNSHRTPVAQDTLADLAAITFDNFIERQEHWLGHLCPPCCPDTSGTKANDHIRGLIVAAVELN